MFKQIGKLASMLKNLPRIREEMERLQNRLGQISAEGDAGAGMVKIRVSGHMEVQRCTLSDEALQDKEMLEDLIRGAVNQAMQRVRVLVAEETGKMTSSLNLPEDINASETEPEA